MIGAPFKLSRFFFVDAGSSADKDGAAFVSFFHFHKSQHKDIGIAADEAFHCKISKFTLGVGGDLVMFAFDQVKDDVGCKPSLSFFIAEPLSAGFVATLDHAAFIFEGAVGAGVGRHLIFLGLGRAAIRLVVRLIFGEREQHNRY